jgi:hypothetical protein
VRIGGHFGSRLTHAHDAYPAHDEYPNRKVTREFSVESGPFHIIFPERQQRLTASLYEGFLDVAHFAWATALAIGSRAWIGLSLA